MGTARTLDCGTTLESSIIRTFDDIAIEINWSEEEIRANGTRDYLGDGIGNGSDNGNQQG